MLVVMLSQARKLFYESCLGIYIKKTGYKSWGKKKENQTFKDVVNSRYVCKKFLFHY